MPVFQKRSIPLYIVLSIVTCGIFYLYWYYCIARDFYDSNTPNRVDMSPIMVIVLNIITCHIYGIYMYYKWGKQSPEVMAMYGRQGEDKSLMYLLLTIFGLDIISICIIQSDFNSLADGGTPPTYGQAPPPQGGYQQQPPPTQNYQQTPPPPPPGSPYNGQQ